MIVAKMPNREFPSAVLLRESYREVGKVKNRTLANLSSWPEAKVEALSQVLKGTSRPADGLDGIFEITAPGQRRGRNSPGQRRWRNTPVGR
jgi:hypothetical protein